MNTISLVSNNEAVFLPETIFVDGSVADHPLTLKTILQFPDIPVEHHSNLDEVMQRVQKTSSDIFGAGKRNLVLTQFNGSFLKKCQPN